MILRDVQLPYIHDIFTILCITLLILPFINTSNERLLRFVAQSGASYAVVKAYFILDDMNTFNHGYQYVTKVHLGFSDYSLGTLFFGVDGFSIMFFFLTTVLIFLCLIYVWSEKSFKYYAINLLIIELLLLMIFSAMDLFVFYICFEGILIPMFFLIGIWGSRERRVRASYLFFYYTLGSSLLALLAILYIYNTVGTLSFIELNEYHFTRIEERILWCAFFLAFATKIPMYPFHVWLPEAHVEAPTVGSVLLAGVLLKLGVYGLIRVNLELFPIASIFYAPYASVLAIFSIFYASYAALGQTDLKRIIAYSSIAHMNLVVLGLMSLNSDGIGGAIFQSISHGFVSAGLFFLVGMIYDRHHTRLLNYYTGLIRVMPIFVTFFLIFTLANIAIPGTSSFIGEYLLLMGSFKKEPLFGALAAVGVILCGTYALWLLNRISFGQSKIMIYWDLEIYEIYILISLLMFIIMLGIYPNDYVFEFIASSCESLVTTIKLYTK